MTDILMSCIFLKCLPFRELNVIISSKRNDRIWAENLNACVGDVFKVFFFFYLIERRDCLQTEDNTDVNHKPHCVTVCVWGYCVISVWLKCVSVTSVLVA